MGNLWVATLNSGWVRADQIIHVFAGERQNPYSGESDVKVRTNLLTGSWFDGGDGELDPLALSLYRGKKERAQDLAQDILIGLIVHADSRAVLQIIDGQLEVVSVGETNP
ncbi:MULTISPECIES: hypothetical protein [unclassified Nocardia]|uniref:hypothetical protein n=1 Tax=unclassified Nocardia TaxID=2637762 RepID=UPI00278C7966|nr:MULTISPECIES: hypothetical protein [unclassified Nocardia]